MIQHLLSNVNEVVKVGSYIRLQFIVTMSYKELNLQSKKFFVCEKEGVENTPDSSKKNEFKIFLAATSDDNNGSLGYFYLRLFDICVYDVNHNFDESNITN